MTIHNEAKKENISKTVIMAGDPLRVKKIATKYLEDAKLVNKVRGMYAYTGTYKGKRITVMAHGMGMPSAGIYVYELYKHYGVEKIIRIGTCGSNNPKIHLLDILLASNSYTPGNYAYTFNSDDVHLVGSSKELTGKILRQSKEKKIPVILGNILTSDCFDWYIQDIKSFNERLPKNLDLLGIEMESFAIFYIAKVLKKQAACLLTVVDSHFDKKEITKNDLNKQVEKMTILALNSVL